MEYKEQCCQKYGRRFNMKISIAIPIHNMESAASFLRRLMQSLEIQTFQDFEIVITKEGKMAENTNASIKKCKGEIIKILYMDDYLAHPDALKNLVTEFRGGWLATGCLHDAGDGKLINPHRPSYDGIPYQVNSIGSPSVIAVENNDPLLFDEKMSWLLDVDYYKKLYERYGEPTLLNSLDVAMGIGEHQMTNILTDEQKLAEQDYLNSKNV